MLTLQKCWFASLVVGLGDLKVCFCLPVVCLFVCLLDCFIPGTCGLILVSLLIMDLCVRQIFLFFCSGGGMCV